MIDEYILFEYVKVKLFSGDYSFDEAMNSALIDAICYEIFLKLKEGVSDE